MDKNSKAAFLQKTRVFELKIQRQISPTNKGNVNAWNVNIVEVLEMIKESKWETSFKTL